MVRVLVLGATGYIGLSTCQTLRRNSHIVYGLARTPEKANELAKNEVIPIIGTVEDGAYLSAIEKHNIDVVIDAAGAYEGSRKVLEDVKRVGAERLQRRGGKKSPKLGLIYTSGTWVHGSSKLRMNDLNLCDLDDDPGCPAPPSAFVNWRPTLENAIIDAKDVLDVLVIRPALVYGQGSHVFGFWFNELQKAVDEKRPLVELQFHGDAVLSLVHVDEVASALTVAAEQISRVGSSSIYPVFDVVTSRESAKLILEGVAQAMGYGGEVRAVKPTGPVMEALNTSARLDSTRLRDLLGWQSKRVFGVLDEVEVFTAAWQAHQKKAQK